MNIGIQFKIKRLFKNSILITMVLFIGACTPYVGKMLSIETGMDKSKVKKIIGSKPDFIIEIHENNQTYEVWEYRLSDYTGSIRGMETSYGIYYFYFNKNGQLKKFGNERRGYRGFIEEEKTDSDDISNKDLQSQQLLVKFITIPPPDNPTDIAVVDFTGNSVSDGDCRALTDRLRTELFNTKHYKVIEREMMEQIIEEQKFQNSGCVTDVCIVKIGEMIGVGKIIGGSISKVGRTYSISSRIVSVETGKILKGATYDYKGEIDELLTNGMRMVAYELIN